MTGSPIQEINLTQAASMGVTLLTKVRQCLNQPFPRQYKQVGQYGTDPDHPHPKKRLNINRLLALCEHLHLDPGYELDYIYLHEFMGGEPVLYTRPDGRQSPLGEVDRQPDRERQLKPFLEHFYFDPLPLGYLQFAIFSVVSNQFYLAWHANYNDVQFVFSLQQARSGSTIFRESMVPEAALEELEKIDFTPHLRIFASGEGRLQAVTFNEWGGFIWQEFVMRPPALIERGRQQVLVPYDCGILF